MTAKRIVLGVVIIIAVLGAAIGFIGWRNRFPEGVHSFRITSITPTSEASSRGARRYTLALELADTDDHRNFQWSGFCSGDPKQLSQGLRQDFTITQFIWANSGGASACFGELTLTIWNRIWPTRQKPGVLPVDIQKRKADLYGWLNEHLQASNTLNGPLSVMFNDCTMSNQQGTFNSLCVIPVSGDYQTLARRIFTDSALASEMSNVGYQQMAFDNEKGDKALFGMQPTPEGWKQSTFLDLPQFMEQQVKWVEANLNHHAWGIFESYHNVNEGTDDAGHSRQEITAAITTPCSMKLVEDGFEGWKFRKECNVNLAGLRDDAITLMRNDVNGQFAEFRVSSPVYWSVEISDAHNIACTLDSSPGLTPTAFVLKFDTERDAVRVAEGLKQMIHESCAR